MSMARWIVSAIILAATAFMVWVLGHIKREQGREPERVTRISSIRAVSAMAAAEDPVSDAEEMTSRSKHSHEIAGTN